MAVSDFSDLDLKLASSEVTLLGGDEVVNQERFTNIDPSIPSENGLPQSKMQNGVSEDLDIKTPIPISQRQMIQSPTESTQPASKRGRPKKGEFSMEHAVVLDPALNPEWLPFGWTVVTKTRPNGKSAGTKDTYYREPVNKRQFRSKREVLEFLADGTRATRSHKKLKSAEDAANTMSSQPINFEPVNQPEKPLKSAQPTNIELASPPEKIKWVLGNSAGTLWTPFIGEERVPERIKLEWAAMFNPLAHKNGGCY